jgi:hypothetical protein
MARIQVRDAAVVRTFGPRTCDERPVELVSAVSLRKDTGQFR